MAKDDLQKTDVEACVEIQVNMTPETNDDVVQLKCDHPSHRHVVACRIRLTSATTALAVPAWKTQPPPHRLRKPDLVTPPRAGSDVTVVLTNPDGRLRFANLSDLPVTRVVSTENADTMRKLVLPKNGAWVMFYITGEKPSQKIGDAVIEVHRDSAKGPVCAKKPVTVFWFDAAKITVKAGGPYGFFLGTFRPKPYPAVTFSASARIMPKDLDHSAPQIEPLRIAVINEMLPDYSESVTYADPTNVDWGSDVAVGKAITVPLSFRVDVKFKSTVKAPINDRRNPLVNETKPKEDKWPLYSNESYDEQEKEVATARLGRSALMRDTPNTEGRLHVPYQDAQGRQHPTDPTKIECRISEWACWMPFRAFCVVWNEKTYQEPDRRDPKPQGWKFGVQVPGTGFPAHCALRQAEWELEWNLKKFKDMKELEKHHPRVTVHPDGPVTVDPSIDGWANDKETYEEKKRTNGAGGTKTFTRTR